MPATEHSVGFGAPAIGIAQPIRVLVRSPSAVRQVDLPLGKTTVGSSPRCSICIEQRDVQPLHCLIVHASEELRVYAWAIETRLNGVSITEAVWKVGDVVSVGSVDLEIAVPPVHGSPARIGEPASCDSHRDRFTAGIRASESRQSIELETEPAERRRPNNQRDRTAETGNSRCGPLGETFDVTPLGALNQPLLGERPRNAQVTATAHKDETHTDQILSRLRSDRSTARARNRKLLAALRRNRKLLHQLRDEAIKTADQLQAVTVQWETATAERQHIQLELASSQLRVQQLEAERQDMLPVYSQSDVRPDGPESLPPIHPDGGFASLDAPSIGETERAIAASEYQRVADDNVVLRDDIMRHVAEEETLAKELKWGRALITRLETEIFQLTKSQDAAADENTQLSAENRSLSEENEQLGAQAVEIQNNIRQLSASNERLVATQSALAEECDRFRIEANELQEQVATLTALQHVLNKDNQALTSQRDAFAQSYASTQESVEQLRLESAALIATVESLSAERDRLSQESDQAERAAVVACQTIDSLTAAKADLHKELERLHQANAASSQQVACLMEEKAALSKADSAVVQECNHLRVEKDELTSEMGQLAAEISRLRDECAAVADDRNRFCEENQRLAQELARANDVVARAGEQHAELVTQCEQLRAELDERERETSQFRDLNVEKDQLANEVEQLAAETLRLREECAAVIDGRDRFCEENQRLARELTQASDVVTRTEEHCAVLVAQREQLRAALDERERETSRIRDLGVEKGQLASEVEQLASAIQCLRDECAAAIEDRDRYCEENLRIARDLVQANDVVARTGEQNSALVAQCEQRQAELDERERENSQIRDAVVKIANEKSALDDERQALAELLSREQRQVAELQALAATSTERAEVAASLQQQLDISQQALVAAEDKLTRLEAEFLDQRRVFTETKVNIDTLEKLLAQRTEELSHCVSTLESATQQLHEERSRREAAETQCANFDWLAANKDSTPPSANEHRSPIDEQPTTSAQLPTAQGDERHEQDCELRDEQDVLSCSYSSVDLSRNTSQSQVLEDDQQSDTGEPPQDDWFPQPKGGAQDEHSSSADLEEEGTSAAAKVNAISVLAANDAKSTGAHHSFHDVLHADGSAEEVRVTEDNGQRFCTALPANQHFDSPCAAESDTRADCYELPRDRDEVQPVLNGAASGDSDDSMEHYLAKMILRLRAKTSCATLESESSVKGSILPPHALPTVESLSNLSDTPICESLDEKLTDLSELRKSEAPERRADLDVLRKVANDSARQALCTYVTRKHHRSAVANLIAATLAGSLGLVLLMQPSTCFELPFICACGFFVIGSYFASKTASMLLAVNRGRNRVDPQLDGTEEMLANTKP